MQYYFYLKYLHVLETVGVFMNNGVTCRVEPINRDYSNVFFEKEEDGKLVQRKVLALRSVPIRKVS